MGIAAGQQTPRRRRSSRLSTFMVLAGGLVAGASACLERTPAPVTPPGYVRVNGSGPFTAALPAYLKRDPNVVGVDSQVDAYASPRMRVVFDYGQNAGLPGAGSGGSTLDSGSISAAGRKVPYVLQRKSPSERDPYLFNFTASFRRVDLRPDRADDGRAGEGDNLLIFVSCLYEADCRNASDIVQSIAFDRG